MHSNNVYDPDFWYLKLKIKCRQGAGKEERAFQHGL